MSRSPVSLFCLLSLAASARAAIDATPIVTVDPVTVVEDRGAVIATEAVDLSALAAPAPESRSLAEIFPSFQVNSNGAFSFNDTFSLRGMANTPIFGSAAVGVYLDEIPLGGPFTLPEDLSGLGSAVLSYGASQGSANGRSGPAGLLQLRSPSVLTEGVHGGASFGAGSHGELHGSLRGSWLAAGDSAYASVSNSRRDGFTYDTSTGSRNDDTNTWSALVRTNQHPLPKLELSLTALVQRTLNGEQPMVSIFGGPDFITTRVNVGRTEGSSANVGLTAAYATPWGRMSSTTSINSWKLEPYVSYLAFGPAELRSDVSLRQRNFNEELRVASGKSAAGESWSGGLFLSDGKTEGVFTRAFGPMTYEASSYTIDGTQAALFGEILSRRVGDFTLGAGLRGELVRAKLNRRESVPAPGTQKRVEESSAFLPRVSLRWQPTAQEEADLSLVTGFKPGGVSAFTGNQALQGFGAERLRGLELGLKSSRLGSGLTASLRGYVYRITGYQIERSFATGAETDDYLVVNAPRAQAVGAEAGLHWSPTTLPALRVSATAGLNHTTLRDFTDPYSKTNYSGLRVPYVPVSDASLCVEYGAATGWFASARASLKGRVYYTEGEESLFSQASRTLLSARLGYAWQQLRVSAYGENLSDRRYWSSISPGTYNGTPGAPLTWGLEAVVSF